MALVVGQIVFAKRQFRRLQSRSYGLDSSGLPGYDEDELVDVRGRRSDVGRISLVSGSLMLVCSFWDQTGSLAGNRYIGFNVTAWTPSTTYGADTFRTANGKLWKCIVGGVSLGSGTGPSGDGIVTDGTAQWVEALPPPSTFEQSAVQTGTIYGVNMWDVDAEAVVYDLYPEAWLAAATSYGDWLELANGHPQEKNPTRVMPAVTVEAIDFDAPPVDVANLARAVEIGGT